MNAENSFKLWLSGAVVCGAAAMGLCRADTIFLVDGSEVNGTIVSESEKIVVIKTARGATRSVRRADIDTIVREKPQQAAKIEEPPPRPADAPKPDARPVPPKDPALSGKISEPLPARDVNSGSGSSAKSVAGQMTPGNENPMPGFPDFARRMSKRKEALFMDCLETIKAGAKNVEDPNGPAALADIQALGSEVMPYLWVGIQSENAAVRVACMKLIGKLNGRTCTKRVIETFYMTMPEESVAAPWNVPFVDETMKTLVTITGQTFILVEARRLPVQDGLKKYIAWYKSVYKTLPRQIGEPELDPNDQNYDAKLDELRALKLTKHEWPSGGEQPVDFVGGPNKTGPEKDPPPTIKDAEREADKKFRDSVPTVPDEKALKRPFDPPGTVDEKDALKRPIDRRAEENKDSPKNQRRDPRDDVPSQSDDKPDPLLRPQDRRRLQQQDQ